MSASCVPATRRHQLGYSSLRPPPSLCRPQLPPHLGSPASPQLQGSICHGACVCWVLASPRSHGCTSPRRPAVSPAWQLWVVPTGWWWLAGEVLVQWLLVAPRCGYGSAFGSCAAVLQGNAGSALQDSDLSVYLHLPRKSASGHHFSGISSLQRIF